MSDLYRADASNFTREQLVELINLQTNLHLEANKTIVIAKGKIEELEHKLERLNKFCKEFIYGEDNPEYYKTMDEKIAEKEARILELKERDERNIERASHYTWLDDKNEELEHKLELAIETLEFYGNIDSWYQDDMDIFDYTILPSDVEQKIHPKTGNSHIAGKRARQALEQLK